MRRKFIECALDGVELIELSGGDAAVFTAPSFDRDGPNEDSALVAETADGKSLLAVADGLGGAPLGEKASALVVQALAKAAGRKDGGKLRVSVLDCLEKANEEIQALSGGAASTLAAAEIGPKGLRTYHVGDSVVLLISGHGRLKWQSVPHSPVGYAVEAGVLDEGDALNHEERHVVSNVIGSGEMSIELGPRLEIKPRDTVLVASDGLMDNLRADEILERATQSPIEAAVESLRTLAAERMRDGSGDAPSKPDDLTLIAFRQRRSRA